jgi:hypothetical protein
MKGEIKSPWWKYRSRSPPLNPKALVAIMGDLVLSSFATMTEREWKPQSPPEVEDDYLYPSKISSRWGRLTPESLACKVWRLWCHPESPACKGRSLRFLGAKTRSLRTVSSETPERLQRLAPLRRKTSLGGWILWPESPTQNQSLRPLQAGVSAQKISNNKISTEFSPTNCKGA